MNCHQCGEIVTVNDNFCEGCGVDLVADSSPRQLDPQCQKCGASADLIDLDRYCSQCGFRQVIAKADDSIELQPAPNLVGASDRGRRHHQNEDAIALSVVDPQTYILVVCDGVSSSQHPELAAQAAATACLEAIEIAIQAGIAPDIAINQGVSSALAAVSRIPFDLTAPEDPSSTTIVTSIVRDRIATIGWVGDSRAYWIGETKSLQLTQDDSWLHEAIASGQITPEAAEQSPYAHAITRWLGADISDDGQPNICTFTIPGAGYLLLCTDGLWNYTPDPTYLYHLIQQAADRAPISIVRYLLQYANQQGGQDNITVGILVNSE